MVDIRRQKSEWGRKASKHFAEGNPEKALAIYHQLEQIDVRDDISMPSVTEFAHHATDLASRLILELRNLNEPDLPLTCPDESAELALFLASDSSSFIFGQVISQDGGWSRLRDPGALVSHRLDLSPHDGSGDVG